MQKKTAKITQKERQVTQVYAALSTLCAARAPDGGIPPQDRWPKTRDIADLCDISIYISRNVLLALVACGRVQVTPHSINNSLRWFIMKNKDAGAAFRETEWRPRQRNRP